MLFDCKPLTLDDRPLVHDFLRRCPPLISEMTFSNLFMWQEKRPLLFAVVEDSLLFFLAKEPHTLFGPPLGPLPLEELLKTKQINRVERVTLPTSISGWTSTSQPEQSDYIYRVEDLIHLPGHPFHRQRQLITGCLERYECQVELITKESLKECRDFLATHLLQEELVATSTLITHYEAWELSGSLVRIGGEVAAVMVGEMLNPTTFVGHISKAERTKHGLYQLLDHTFAERVAKDFCYLNLEQDLGLEGLKTAKERLQPTYLVVKWCIGRTDS